MLKTFVIYLQNVLFTLFLCKREKKKRRAVEYEKFAFNVFFKKIIYTKDNFKNFSFYFNHCIILGQYIRS